MEIKPSVEIEDFEGQPMPITKIATACPHCNGKLDVDSQMRGIIENTGKNLTLKTVCVNALSAQYRGEENIEGMEKLKRGKLAEKIFSAKNNENIHLSNEEINDLKILIGKKDDPLIVLRAYELLDPTPEEKPKKKKK